MSEARVPLQGYETVSDAEMSERTSDMLATLLTRRTVRDFSDAPVPREIIETAIKAAATGYF